MYVHLKDTDATCALKSLREKRVGNFSCGAKKGWRNRDASVVHIRENGNLTIGMDHMVTICVYMYVFRIWVSSVGV